MPKRSASAICASDGTETVKAFRAAIPACVCRSGRTETATAGGFEEQIPPQATVIAFGRPLVS